MPWNELNNLFFPQGISLASIKVSLMQPPDLSLYLHLFEKPISLNRD